MECWFPWGSWQWAGDPGVCARSGKNYTRTPSNLAGQSCRVTSVGFVGDTGTLPQVVPEPGNLRDLSQSRILSEPRFFLTFIPVKLLFTLL